MNDRLYYKPYHSFHFLFSPLNTFRKHPAFSQAGMFMCSSSASDKVQLRFISVMYSTSPSKLSPISLPSEGVPIPLVEMS